MLAVASPRLFILGSKLSRALWDLNVGTFATWHCAVSTEGFFLREISSSQVKMLKIDFNLFTFPPTVGV